MSQFSSNIQDFEEYKDENVLNQAENDLVHSLSRNDIAKVKSALIIQDRNQEINLFIIKDPKFYTGKLLSQYLFYLNVF